MNDEQCELVAAYHDGELDEVGSRAARHLIDTDAEARDYWNALQRLNGTLHAAFDPIVSRPVPAVIQAAAGNASRRGMHQFWVPLALAASLALIAVLLVRQGSLDRQMQNRFSQMQQQIAQLRNQALENVPSGTAATWAAPAGRARVEVMPVKTYRTGDNQYCREYEERIADAQGVEIRRGIACRAGKALWSELDAPPSLDGAASGGARPGVRL